MKFSFSTVTLVFCTISFLCSCNNNNSRDEWKSIEPGYSYQFTGENKDKEDVFHIKKGYYVYSGIQMPIAEDSLLTLSQSLLSSDSIKNWKKSLSRGIVGKLQINLDTVYRIMNGNIPIQIFLRETYRLTDLQKDTLWLKQQSFCKEFAYKSKEDAMKEWIEMGNQDFRDFIDTNILPQSFEIRINPSFFSSNALDSIRAVMKDSLHNVTDISIPRFFPFTPTTKAVVIEFEFSN